MSTYFVLLCTFAVIPVIVSGYRCFYGDNVGGKLFPQEDLKWQDGNKTSIHSFALIDCPEKYCATLTADYEDDDETIKTRIRWKGCNVVERYNLTHQLVETSRACTKPGCIDVENFGRTKNARFCCCEGDFCNSASWRSVSMTLFLLLIALNFLS